MALPTNTNVALGALDPAGLAIADRRVAAQAIRDANDGISLLAVGDQVLGLVGDVLARLAELASQSASASVSDAERTSLDREFQALVAEIDRLVARPTFDGVGLLDGTATITLHVGLGGTARSRIDVGTVDVTTATLFGGTTPGVAGAGDAQAARAALAAAIETLVSTRATFGAAQGRLELAVTTLQGVETYAAAASRIRDADVAAETAAATRAQILQARGVAVLTQANHQASLVLELLG